MGRFRNRDSMILIVRRVRGGAYIIESMIWHKTPPPVRIEDIPRLANNPDFDPTTNERAAADKTELKNKLGNIVDNEFDMP